MPDVLAPLPNPSQYLLPTEAYRPPGPNFDWLGNLPETALANQQRRYQLAALQLGMQQSQDLARMLQDPSLMGGGMGGGGTGAIGRTSSAAPSGAGGGVTLASYSPTGDVGDRLFHAVYGNESNWGADTRTSNRGASGPMQITQGTFNANALPGESIRNPDDNMRVGRRILDKYLKQYNGDPARAMVAYFSGEGNVAPPGSQTPWKRNSNDGHWTVAQYVTNGLAKMRGADGSAYAPQQQAYRSDQLNPKDRAAVDAMYGKPADQPTNIALNATGKGYGDGTSTARPAPDENVARETPGGLPSGLPFAPNMATAPNSPTGPASSRTNTGPYSMSLAAYAPTQSNIGAQPPGPANAFIPTSASEAAGNQGGGATAPTATGFGGRPPEPITAVGRDNLSQPAAATTQPQPQRMAQAGPARQPLPRIEDNPDIRQLDNAITGLQQRHAIVSGMTFAPNRDATLKVIEQRIEDFQKQRDARYNTLKEQYAKQQETEEKGIAGREQTARELGAKVQEAQIKRSDDLTAGINSTARDYETELEPYIKLGRSILNQPGMYTGFGGERSLDFNKVRAAFGDRTAAQLQETFKKVRGQVILGTSANQRTQMQAAGEKSARLFARTADTIEEAIPGLETSPAGILSLMEIQARLGEQSKRIRDMAASYKAEQIRNGRLPVLDDEFDARVSRSLEKDPPFTDYDLAHPQTLGAPTAPAGLTSKEDYTNWGRSVGLRPGDPFRTRNGKVVPLP